MPQLSSLALLACLALVACGVDGAPQPPSQAGITISGDARFGVTN